MNTNDISLEVGVVGTVGSRADLISIPMSLNTLSSLSRSDYFHFVARYPSTPLHSVRTETKMVEVVLGGPFS